MTYRNRRDPLPRCLRWTASMPTSMKRRKPEMNIRSFSSVTFDPNAPAIGGYRPLRDKNPTGINSMIRSGSH